jgi:hypothetical protein
MRYLSSRDKNAARDIDSRSTGVRIDDDADEQGDQTTKRQSFLSTWFGRHPPDS